MFRLIVVDGPEAAKALFAELRSASASRPASCATCARPERATRLTNMRKRVAQDDVGEVDPSWPERGDD